MQKVHVVIQQISLQLQAAAATILHLVGMLLVQRLLPVAVVMPPMLVITCQETAQLHMIAAPVLLRVLMPQ